MQQQLIDEIKSKLGTRSAYGKFDADADTRYILRWKGKRLVISRDGSIHNGIQNAKSCLKRFIMDTFDIPKSDSHAVALLITALTDSGDLEFVPLAE